VHRNSLAGSKKRFLCPGTTLYAEKEGVERIKERRNSGRVIGGRGKMGRSRVGLKGGRTI